MHRTFATWLRQKSIELFSIDLRSLALFRIAVSMLLLADLAQRLRDLRSFYTDESLWPRSLAFAEMATRKGAWSLHTLGGTAGFELALFGIAALTALALMFGFHTRTATALAWMLTISLQNRAYMLLHAGDKLLGLYLFWGFFLPLGARWSLDARKKLPRGTRVISAATIALILQICIVYWFNAAYKSEPIWRVEGTAVRYALNMDRIATGFGHRLIEYPRFLKAMTFGTIWLEAFGPFLVLMPVATGLFRLLAVVFFVSFHLFGLATAMRLGLFPYISAAGWLIFLPPIFWEKMQSRFGLKTPASAAVLSSVEQTVDDHFGTRRWSRGLAWIANGCAVVVFVYIVLWNLRGYDSRRWKPFCPHQLDRIAYALGIEQKWSLFTTNVLISQAWHVVLATLRNGSEADLLSGKRDDFWRRPDRIGEHDRTPRWGKYPAGIRSTAHQDWLKAYADFLAREWNQQHSADEQVESVRIFLMSELNAIPRPEAQKYLLYDSEHNRNAPLVPTETPASSEHGNLENSAN